MSTGMVAILWTRVSICRRHVHTASLPTAACRHFGASAMAPLDYIRILQLPAISRPQESGTSSSGGIMSRTESKSRDMMITTFFSDIGTGSAKNGRSRRALCRPHKSRALVQCRRATAIRVGLSPRSTVRIRWTRTWISRIVGKVPECFASENKYMNFVYHK